MKTKLYLSLLGLIILFLSSCSSSMVGVGMSSDKGKVGTPSGNEVDKFGTGLFIEYRWQQMKGRHGYGIDVNSHLNGYFELGTDGLMFSYNTLQGKYYYTLSQDENNFLRLDFAAGFGLGAVNTDSDPVLISNLSFDFHFPKNRLLYLSTKYNFVSPIKNKEWKGGTAFEIGLGVRFRK